MKVKTFFIGLIASFALPLVLVVVYPYMSMRDQQGYAYEDKDGNKKIYVPADSHHKKGEQIYRQENCQACHTQVVRNSEAGSEIFRADWAGFQFTDADGDVVLDTRRESTMSDYRDDFASIGERRNGPDLMNYGVRIKAQVAKANLANKKAIAAGEMKPFTADELIYLRLYNPRIVEMKGMQSNCASNRHLFDKVNNAGQGSLLALPIKTRSGLQIVPNSNAKALKDYLLGKDHDQVLPEGLSKAQTPDTEAK